MEITELASWNVTSISPTSMDFKLTFKDPLFVSYSQADVLVVEFIDMNLFRGQEEGVPIDKENRVIRRELMR